LLNKPQFKDHFHVEVLGGEGVFVISELGHSVLNGPLFERVVPLIDGQRVSDDIVEELQALHSPAEVYYALTVLERKGYLRESGTSLSVGEATYWGVEQIATEAVARHLAEIEVSLTCVGGVRAEGLVELLRAWHVRVGDNGTFGAVVTDDFLRPVLQTYNREALQHDRPWILIKPLGSQILIGPIFSPKSRTGCWDCLAPRLRMNRSIEMFVQRKLKRTEPLPMPQAATPALQQIAYGIAATQIAKWIVQSTIAPAEGIILSIDVHTWRMDVHRLVRDPRCPACGDPPSIDHQVARPLLLESRRKTYTEDGGHRVVAPRETFRRYEHHLSPLTGAVKALEPLFVEDDGVIHAYLAGENHGVWHQNLGHLQRDLRSRSSGKGMTDEQAKISGLCEALERHSGVFRGTEIRRRTTLRALGELGIHPNDCMRFSERQYVQRDAINARGSRFQHVPLPFQEDLEIDWTPVWSLTRRVHRYLPTEYCYYDYPSSPGQSRCIACSNGNAAGNNLEEAILQGFLELVERDSVAMWWYNRVRRPGVDLDSFDVPYLNKLRAFLRHRHFDLSVLDLTSDLGVPVFAAISRRTDRVQEQIMFGMGAHIEARIAVLRAVAELNQMLAWILRSETSDGDISHDLEDTELVSWLNTATADDHPYLVPDDRSPLRKASSYQALWTDDVKEDVLFCQRLIERHGMEMLVLDQTRPDIELPVVKVIVPGLRHFWARYAPGRLYDVPASLGWVARPLQEEQLNPIPFLL
jgi:bacteriocin biosynthesis cyclodehydratase domain-containing protein